KSGTSKVIRTSAGALGSGSCRSMRRTSERFSRSESSGAAVAEQALHLTRPRTLFRVAPCVSCRLVGIPAGQVSLMFGAQETFIMRAVLLTGLLLSSSVLAAPPAQMSVPTALGPKAFRDGDVIEITDVRATSPKLEQGDSLTVRGRVRLASQDHAQLGLYLTQTEGGGSEETDPSQTMQVKRGLGEFELKATI